MQSDSNLCHLCSNVVVNERGVRNMTKCCKRKCSKIFCKNCVLTKIDSEFKIESVKPETWICYSCGEHCPCDLCKKKGRTGFHSQQRKLFHGNLRSDSIRSKADTRSMTSIADSSSSLVVPVNVSSPIQNEEKHAESQPKPTSRLRKHKGSENIQEKIASPTPADNVVPKVNAMATTAIIEEINENTSKPVEEPMVPSKKMLELTERVESLEHSTPVKRIQSTATTPAGAEKSSQNNSRKKAFSKQISSILYSLGSIKRSLRGNSNPIEQIRMDIIDNLFKRKRKVALAPEPQLIVNTKERDQKSTSSQPAQPNNIDIKTILQDDFPEENMPILKNELELQSLSGNAIENVKIEMKKDVTFVNLKRRNGKNEMMKFENRYLFKKKLMKFKGSMNVPRNQNVSKGMDVEI